MKKKLKLDLLDEYMFILNIQNIFKNYGDIEDREIANCINLCENLKKKYEQIFLKLGVIDLSFMILKKELNNENLIKYHSFLNLKDNINEINLKINDYSKSLHTKMKKLHFNEFEINFIVNFS
ncbi:MAG: hypothetical protein IJ837_04230 [Clostridia bacterium]|nr:hypothetical protein [Clostridia bacterium]